MDATAAAQLQARPALVCCDAPERRTVIKAALEQLGFLMVPAKSAAEAIERMRRETFEVVVLDEQFQGGLPLDNTVLDAIRGIPMPIRRYMFVTLLGREYKTFDNMLAFTKSVNVVVNLNDLSHLPIILRKAILENNEFYRVFREALHEAGRR